MSNVRPPLLPLLLADVPTALCRALEQEGVPTREHKSAAAGRFVLFDSLAGGCPPLAMGQTAIDVHTLRTALGRDPFKSLDREQARRCQWQIGHLTVSEEVAAVDKRAVRAALVSQLRGRIEAAGGMWLRVAPFPYPYRSAFNFRLDYDEFDAGDFEAVLAATAGREDAFSHFVCGSSFAAHPEALARLRGRDVGSHGYWHHTYLDKDENRRNVARGIEVLRGAGIEPAGFAAPHGRFNRGLLEVLDALGVSHSSEFGLAYDDLPFWPAGSQVLQIPVHPLCLGICLEAARQQAPDDPAAALAAADALADHFRKIAGAKYQAGEPVFLYGHPERRLGRYPQVLSSVLEAVDGMASIWQTTLTQFAHWWRARAQLRIEVHEEPGRYAVRVVSRPADYRFGVEYWRGEHAAPLPLDESVVRFSPQALAFRGRKPRPAPDLLRIDQPPPLRASLLRYLDWEKVTPVDEISPASWRGWLKRTLRRAQSR